MRIKVDPQKAKLVDNILEITKELPSSSLATSPELSTDFSIDGLMRKGLNSIYRLMRVIDQDISTGVPSRDTVQNLKDCMSMLENLKKREENDLASLSEDELEKIASSE